MRSASIRCVIEAARAGSISAAARALDLSQPTVSERIRSLEEELGVVLLARQSGGVSLTPSGATLLPMLEQVIASHQQVRETAAQLTELARGLTTVSSVGFAARGLLPRALREVSSAHPGLEFQISEAGSMTVLSEVLAGSADLGLWTAPITTLDDFLPTTVIAKLLEPVSLVAVCPPGHPLTESQSTTMREVAANQLILPPGDYVIRQLLKEYDPELAGRVRLVAGSIDTRLRHVAEGLGVSVEVDVAEEFEKYGTHVRTIPLRDEEAQLGLNAIYSSQRQPSRSTRRLLSALRGLTSAGRAGHRRRRA